MRSLFPFFLGPPFLALALGSSACGGTTVQPFVSQANPLDSEETSLITALDKLRADAGIMTPLIVCTALNVSTSKHSDDMRDHDYLSDMGKDGSTARTRGCAAGYTPGCGTTIAMAEMVASGVDLGAAAIAQWEKDSNTKALLVNPAFLVAGTGRSLNGTVPIWSLDLASADDASCK